MSVKLRYLIQGVIHRCDTVTLTGSTKPTGENRNSFAHAQKMRAAMTYAFGRVHNLGSIPWHQSETTGLMVGNPSISELVSSYMLSLNMRKVGHHLTLATSDNSNIVLQVRAGEAPTSARAITSVSFMVV